MSPRPWTSDARDPHTFLIQLEIQIIRPCTRVQEPSAQKNARPAGHSSFSACGQYFAEQQHHRLGHFLIRGVSPFVLPPLRGHPRSH